MFHYADRSGWLAVCLCVSVVVAELTEDLIPLLYLKYKEAFNDGESSISIRRLSTNNKQYEIHIKHLKEVNGFKKHNLLVKETLRSNENPLIYINNPVEAKLPNSYLSLEEFKHTLTNRIKLQKEELAAQKERTLNKKTKTRMYATKSVSNNKIPRKTTTHLILNTSNRVKSTTLSTKGPNKQITKVSTKNLLTKVKSTVKINEISKQTKVTTRIINLLPKTASTQILKDTNLSSQDTSILIERTATSLKKVEASKSLIEENKIQNITVNKLSTQALQETSELVKTESNSTTLTSTGSNDTEVITEVNKLKETDSTTLPNTGSKDIESIKEITKLNCKEIVLNESNTITTNSVYHSSNSSTTVNNVTTAIYPETISSKTKNFTEFTTLEVKKETSKRTTRYKRPTKRLTTKSTKRRRTTLGRPRVFME